MLIKSCSIVVTQNPKREILRDVDIVVEEGRIKEIGTNRTGEPVINGKGKVWLPGLINTHAHIGMHLLRGICDDEELPVWLDKVTKAEAKLSEEDVQDGAVIGIQEMLTTGTTTFVEMYWPMGPVLRAVKKHRIRAVLFPTWADALPNVGGDMNSELKRILKEVKDIPHIKVGIGAHSIYSVTDERIRKMYSAANQMTSTFAIHLAETRSERVNCFKEHGKLPVEYADSLGVLSSNTLIAHAVWLTKAEIRLLGERGVKVSHNPVSNLKLAGGGVMPLPEMWDAGICVGLGTDSVASNNSMDLFEAMKVTGLIHKHHRWDAKTAPVQRILDMGTIDGARCLGMEQEIGSLEQGKWADIISIPLDHARMQPCNNVISNLVYAVNGSCVSDVLVAGEFAVREGIMMQALQ
ncbi:amidohydrolase [Candidatus Woesearchaeota archaeon]|nr:amidohydrolase [Candidatus Woesearchaeota archaeon]